MTAALEGGEWSAARLGCTLPSGKTRYPLYRRLGGPQGRSGRAENLVPTGIRSRTAQPVVSRYTGWAIRPILYIYIYIYIYIYLFILTTPTLSLITKTFPSSLPNHFPTCILTCIETCLNFSVLWRRPKDNLLIMSCKKRERKRPMTQIDTFFLHISGEDNQ